MTNVTLLFQQVHAALNDTKDYQKAQTLLAKLSKEVPFMTFDQIELYNLLVSITEASTSQIEVLDDEEV